jgi:multidrug efflux pump subunit AcrA (membrane-fusion protein)
LNSFEKMANGIVENVARSEHRNWMILVGVLGALIVFTAYVSLGQRKLQIQVTSPKRQAILNSISTNGKIEPQLNLEAHAPIATTVKRILVHEGDQAQGGNCWSNSTIQMPAPIWPRP